MGYRVERVITLEKLSAQNHKPFGTGPDTRDALILIRGGKGVTRAVSEDGRRRGAVGA